MLVVTDNIQYSVDDDTIESIRTNYPKEISDLYANALRESKTFEELEAREKEFDRQADAYDRIWILEKQTLLPADLGGLFD